MQVETIYSFKTCVHHCSTCQAFELCHEFVPRCSLASYFFLKDKGSNGHWLSVNNVKILLLRHFHVSNPSILQRYKTVPKVNIILLLIILWIGTEKRRVKWFARWKIVGQWQISEQNPGVWNHRLLAYPLDHTNSQEELSLVIFKLTVLHSCSCTSHTVLVGN